MNKTFGLLILAIFFSACNHKSINGISFKECDFEDNNENRWISTAAEAKQFLNLDTAKLTNQEYLKQLDSTYSKKAQYIFLIGGGCFHAHVKEMEVEIKNDTLNIIWNEPLKICPSTGKRARTNMCLELDKNQYPNYKNFKITKSQK